MSYKQAHIFALHGPWSTLITPMFDPLGDVVKIHVLINDAVFKVGYKLFKVMQKIFRTCDERSPESSRDLADDSAVG